MTPVPALVTSAGISPEDERKARERRYFITMMIRTLSFVLAVVLPIPLVWKLPAIILAMVLPWLAVTAANAGPVQPKTGPGPEQVTERTRPVTPTERLSGPTIIDLDADGRYDPDSDEKRSGR